MLGTVLRTNYRPNGGLMNWAVVEGADRANYLILPGDFTGQQLQLGDVLEFEPTTDAKGAIGKRVRLVQPNLVAIVPAFARLSLRCVVCGEEFVFTIRQQRFYFDRRLATPRRCEACLRARRQASRA